MFEPTVAIGELVIRSLVVYLFVLILLRTLGKKARGRDGAIRPVVLLILSESVQNALVADDTSLTGGLVVAGTIFCISQVFGYITWKNKRIERFLDGGARVLVRNGKVDKEAMARKQVTHSELLEALRREGCTSITRVRYAVLENDGAITVGMRFDGENEP